MKHRVAALAWLGLAVLWQSPALAAIDRATTTGGVVVGRGGEPVSTFLGIPFAAPPVGELRWRAPAPVQAWQGVREARAFGPSCMQNPPAPGGFGPWTPEYLITGPLSEDCLYLNVWTPARGAGEKLPVLVWIYGGAFREGSGSVPIYDGAAFARRGIVVVNFNYRLGVFGFLTHPGLRAESAQQASGNYGLLDQVAALRWVQRNIAAFGGDPARVTIAGQSAGAASVHHLLASPLARGLFHQAIAQSGSGTGIPLPPAADVESRGLQLQQLTGASDLAGLRRMGAEALLKATTAPGQPLQFGPTVDGHMLPAGTHAERPVHDVPMLTGMTANEFTGLNPQLATMSAEAWTTQLRNQYAALAPRALALYGPREGTTVAAQVDAHARERGLAAMAFWAEARSAVARQPVHAYLWSHVEPGPDAARYQAFHSSEIPYVFGTLQQSSQRAFTSLDHRLADQLGGYWANFVKQGNPNGAGLPAWPAYTTASAEVQGLDEKIAPRPLLSTDRLSLFRDHVRAAGQVSLLGP